MRLNIDDCPFQMFLLILWTLGIFLALTLFYRQKYSRFKISGVKHYKPIPPLGNMASLLLRKEHFTDILLDQYFSFPGERFVGRYEFTKPQILIRDIELIKKIAVKDFEYFLDHRTFFDEGKEPFFSRNLISLKGQEWKDMRSTLSPAFTSSKIRVMVPFMLEVCDQMTMSLRNKIAQSNVGYLDVDTKDLTTRYANDVIASCAFGLKVDSQADENNEFYRNGRESTNFGFRHILIFTAFAIFPWIMKKTKLSIFSESTKLFFKDMVLDTMKEREKNNIIRPDMIHLLMEAKKGQLTHDDKTIDADAGFATVEESVVGKKEVNIVWSDSDLIAQAVLFFMAGFETVSSSMTFLLHELAMNPDVQEKLVQEIREHWEKSGGKLDFTSIQNMTYMDMVISENLRLWPPAIALDRQTTKDYNLGKPNDSPDAKDYIIQAGEGLSVPIWSIHRDPEYYPEPLKFDPERFSEENKHKIKPFTYMPFGLGPRNCIGSRFALCEMKVMIYQLLLKMIILPSDKTVVPIVFTKDTFSLKAKGGYWVRIKNRTK